MREVILVHGLWAPGLVMQPLAAHLGARGFRCRLFSYAGRNRPLAASAERLARFARAVGRAHFVGHSLGGLLVLETLSARPELEAASAVLLGTPARGSHAGRRLARHGLGRWMLGESAALLREGRTARWARPEPLGIVAGTLPLGLGRALGPLPGPNDGVVCVEETAVDGARARLVLPVSHSLMLVSSRVAANVAEFLAHAQFLPDAR
jgi:pimeloyl-ACP methyl ester carboxylesterase